MRNFSNKLWNASRFVLMNLTVSDCALPETLEAEDKWILSKLNDLVAEVTDNLERYELASPPRNSTISSGAGTATGISS